MNKILSFFFIIYASQSFAIDAESLGRGGTYITESSLLQSMFFSPSNLRQDNFSIDISASVNGSVSFFNLIQEDFELESNYERRLSPYFGSAINTAGQGGVGLNYKGYTIYPYLIYIEGSAVLNDPAYPYASVILRESQGFGMGYGGIHNKINYGFSTGLFTTKKRDFIANVLNYDEISNEIESVSKNYIGNISLGYNITPKLSIASNYQYSEISAKKTNLLLGSKIDLNKVKFLIELQDLERFDFYQSFHAGLDWQALKFLTLKIGSNETYLTYGASFNFKYFKINAASSGFNQYEYYRKEYRNYSIDLSLGYNL